MPEITNKVGIAYIDNSRVAVNDSKPAEPPTVTAPEMPVELSTKINVAFFGTSDRSISILEALSSDEQINLILCVTKADTVVGRKHETRETEVKKWAKNKKVKFITTQSLKKDVSDIIEQLMSSKVDLCVVADFSFIIPEELISIPRKGFINIHFSLLPKWRGASPIQFAILNGDEATGITYHLVEKGLDSGDVLHQIGYKLVGKETSGELYKKLFPLAAENLPKVIKGFSNETLKPIKQEESQATYTYSPSHPNSTFIYKEDAQINWDKTPEEIERSVRAYFPWPVAWTTLEELEKMGLKLKPAFQNSDKKVKILEAEVKEERLKINKLQLEGKKPTDWSSFINGYFVNANEQRKS